MGDTAYSASSGDTKATYAAKVCSTYTGGGWDDWFLPSRDESHQMYTNLRFVAGWVSDQYWSSSEVTAYAASCEYYASSGNISDVWRADLKRVRPVRAF
jgi:hypothetical protein